MTHTPIIYAYPTLGAERGRQSRGTGAFSAFTCVLAGHGTTGADDRPIGDGQLAMNTREEILQAIEDYQAGRFGTIPADQLAPKNFRAAVDFGLSAIRHACLVCGWDPALAASADGVPPPLT